MLQRRAPERPHWTNLPHTGIQLPRGCIQRTLCPCSALPLSGPAEAGTASPRESAVTLDTPPKTDPPLSPGLRREPTDDQVTSLLSSVFAFCVSYGVSAFVQMYTFGMLAYAWHNNRTFGVLWTVLLIGVIEYFVLGLVVQRRKQAAAEGRAIDPIAEMALLGIALSTLLMGVCASAFG